MNSEKSSLQRIKSLREKTTKKPVLLSQQLSKRTTIQSPDFIRELQHNQQFLNQREKLSHAEKRKSMSLGDLQPKERSFLEKITSKLSKSKSMSVKDIKNNALIQKYRNKDKEVKFREFKEFEKYQENRVEDRPSTPKFPLVQEPVQLRKSNSLKPARGNSRSNTIHVVQAANNLDQNLEQDIQISAPLKLIWRGGRTETIDRGAVVFKNGLLQIQNDANNSKQEIKKVSSTIKNNKMCEFWGLEQTIRVEFDKAHQITMGSPRQRRKSVEEESPKSVSKQNKLIKLLRRRSDKQLLEKKGIFKCEDIFGNKLSVLHESSQSKIPEFVRKAVELIEMEKNIKSEHIYRLSGNMAIIQKIRLKIDGKNYRVLEEYKNEVDVLTGCLKLFYRELVEPLIPFKTFEELRKLSLKTPSVDRDKSVKSIIQKMETPHKENLLFLILHLLKVETYKQYNKMTLQSLSIVWGPSMLWYPGPEKCGTYTPYDFSMLVNSVLEFILTTYQTDPETVHLLQLKNCSAEDISKAAAIPTKWHFGFLRTESRDKLNASTLSLADTKKEKPSNDGYFGRSLESLAKAKNTNVPKIIVDMVKTIEKHSNLHGLYQKPSCNDPVGKFKKKLQKKADISKMDPLDISVVLLKFLQELETPLLGGVIYEDFKENNGKMEEKNIAERVREGIGNLNVEHQATIEYLANHIQHVFDHQTEFSRENICNTWLPIFSNSTEVNSHNSDFMETILNIYKSNKELPTKILPLKSDFDYTIRTRRDTNSMDENYISDSDKMGLQSRTISSISDNTTPSGYYRTSMSVDESRMIRENLYIVENISKRSNKESGKMAKEEDAKRQSDTQDLHNKIYALKEGNSKNVVTIQAAEIKDIPQIVLDSDDGAKRKSDGDTKTNPWTKVKGSIESKQLQDRIANLNHDNPKIVDKRDLDNPRKDVDMKKIIDSFRSNKRDLDNFKKNVDTPKKNVDKVKKVANRMRTPSPSPARAQRLAGVKTNLSPLATKKSIEGNVSTPKMDHRSRSTSRTNNPSPIITRKHQDKDDEQSPESVKKNPSPVTGKKTIDEVEEPQIGLKTVLSSPAPLRKNKNALEVSRNDEGDSSDKTDTRPSVFVKNSRRIGVISKTQFNNLSKIIAAQSLENLKARTEMSLKKT